MENEFPEFSFQLAGALRRKVDYSNAVSIFARGSVSSETIDRALSVLEPKRVLSRDIQAASLLSANEIKINLEFFSHETHALEQLFSTGDTTHINHLSERASQKGLELKRESLSKHGAPLHISSEEDLYRELGLSNIPPEVRDNPHAITFADKAFQRGVPFPRLISKSDLHGILHAHTTYSDGRNSLRELAIAVRQQGFEYLGISDHSQSLTLANGLSEDEIRRQHDEIDNLNEDLTPFRIFKGIESDILLNGDLDYPDRVLETFDFIVASVHSHFGLSPSEMTARIVKAIEHPYTTILGHLTGRVLLARDGYLLDLEQVFEAAAKAGVAIELNANPSRLDMDWHYHLRVAESGILIPICSDAHSVDDLAGIDHAVIMARKGLLQKEHVLNTLGRDDIAYYFKQSRSG